MTNLRDKAKGYVPQTTMNVADLDVVSLDYPIVEREGKDKDNNVYKYNVVLVMGEEYRIPNSVIGDIKTIMSAKPTLKTIRVIKKGTGMNTEYTVIPLE